LPRVNFILPWVNIILPWVNFILPWVNLILPWVNLILPWLFTFAVTLVGHRKNLTIPHPGASQHCTVEKKINYLPSKIGFNFCKLFFPTIRQQIRKFSQKSLLNWARGSRHFEYFWTCAHWTIYSFAFYPGETPGTKFSNNSPPPDLSFCISPGVARGGDGNNKNWTMHYACDRMRDLPCKYGELISRPTKL
jgi:hypothetical protein